jgi:hypothetical protein
MQKELSGSYFTTAMSLAENLTRYAKSGMLSPDEGYEN